MNLALFDFDGTITATDSFVPFVRRAISPARQIAGQIILLPMIVGYKAGLISASRTRSMIVAVGLRGRREADVRAVGVRYAQDVLPNTIRPKAIERIQWHRNQGDEIVVVSAALNVYLDEWCQMMGLGLICTRLETRLGVLTGRYLEGDCVGKEKTRRVRARYDLQKYQTIYAYGDTTEDAELLNLAHHKFYRWQEIFHSVDRGRKSDHVDQNPNR